MAIDVIVSLLPRQFLDDLSPATIQTTTWVVAVGAFAVSAWHRRHELAHQFKRSSNIHKADDALFEVAHHAALGGAVVLFGFLALSGFSPKLGQTLISSQPGMLALAGAYATWTAIGHLARNIKP